MEKEASQVGGMYLAEIAGGSGSLVIIPTLEGQYNKMTTIS